MRGSYLGGDRPRWAERVRWWLVDGQFDRLMKLPDDHWRWKVGEVVERVGVGGLCVLFGHKVVDDQCQKPEHRFCAFCSKRRPGVPCGRTRRTRARATK